jgi:hypothetical protein
MNGLQCRKAKIRPVGQNLKVLRAPEREDHEEGRNHSEK